MKSFKNFLMETNDPNKYGTPVIIHQGSGSLPQRKKPMKSDDPNKFGTPVIISQGAHSESDKKKKKSVKEDVAPPDPQREVVHKGLEAAADENHGKANQHLGSRLREVNAALEAQHNVHENPHFDMLHSYTASSFNMNNHLYDVHTKGKSMYGDHETDFVGHQHIPSMDAALDHHELQTPLTVFSGVKFHPGVAAAKDPKSRIFLPAYTSTSVSPSIAAGFAKWFKSGSSEEDAYHGPTDQHVLKIGLEPGQKGAYMGTRSKHRSEHEFIMPRRTSLEVHPVPQIHHYRDTDGNLCRLHVWSARPVSHEE